jgi:hypothetical protein
MKRRLMLALICSALAGCGVARTAGDVAIGTGQVVLGAADLVI